MAPNPQLDDAIIIFFELGWPGAALTDAPTLPLGTPEQQRAALDGLRSGNFDDTSPFYAALSWSDQQLLGLFAIRVGITARRAATVLLDTRGLSERWPVAAAAVVAGRGQKYAQQFVDAAVAGRARRVNTLASVVVHLVHHCQFHVPERSEYVETWASWALAALWPQLDPRHGFNAPRRRGLPAWEVPPHLAERFVEHVRVGVEVRASGTGSFGLVVPAGVGQGWLLRDEAVALVLAAMDQATASTERVAWLRVWLDALDATPEEIVAQAQALVPVLATGSSEVVERLGPPLVAGVDDDLLAEVVIAALVVPTKKARLAVLRALAARPRPSQATIERVGRRAIAVGPRPDQTLARVSVRVLERWGLAP